MFLILVRNILCPQQMFSSLPNMETMLPRFQYFPGLLVYLEHAQNFLLVRENGGKYSTAFINTTFTGGPEHDEKSQT